MAEKKIRLALVGVGNCACSLVQGIEFYKTPEIAEEAGGLMHYNLGGYVPSDIEVVVEMCIRDRSRTSISEIMSSMS